MGINYNRNHMLHVLTRWAILAALLAVGLFLAAGTTRIPTLRASLAVFSAMLLLTMLSVDPGLAQERSQPRADGQDTTARSSAGFLFLVAVGFAAMDVGRLHQSDIVPGPLSVISLIVFAVALAIQMWAMIVNPFFSPVIRIQAERGHRVTTRGPYRWLRHPGYLAIIVAIPASALAIGSWLALIPAAAFDHVIARRARGRPIFEGKSGRLYRLYAARPRRFFPAPAVVQDLFFIEGAVAMFWLDFGESQ